MSERAIIEDEKGNGIMVMVPGAAGIALEIEKDGKVKRYTITDELPYDGAKEMLLVDDREYLTGLCEAMYAELPTPKPQKME